MAGPITKQLNTRRSITAIDLFCGAGGLTRGLLDGGIQVVAGVDVDGACRFAYERNNGARFIEKSVTTIDAKMLDELYGEGPGLRLLAGCAPCQPFSTYTQGRDTTQDEKWGLLGAFGALVAKVRPELVTMENVPQLKKHSVFKEFLKTLETEGYEVSVNLVFGPDYGLPQARTRLVLLASRLGPIELVPPTRSAESYMTVAEAIRDLEPLKAGQESKKDPLHRAAKLSARNLERMKASRPGGTWRDWKRSLVTPCHRSDKGASYSGVYGRMEWGKPSPTITTQCYAFGSGRFGHPEQDRAITLREAALLQTFPPGYEFIGPGSTFSFKRLGDLIGNAVPVRLGTVIADSLRIHVEQYAQR